MRRRDKTGGKAAKRQHRKTVRRRNTAKVARRRKPYAADANEKVALLEQKLNEALEQQTAMSEILGVISNSPTDLAPVFSAILANATRLCEGNLAALWRYDGKFLIGAAQYNASAAFVDKYMGTKMEPGRAGPARLAALERRTVHVADITAEPGFLRSSSNMSGPARFWPSRCCGKRIWSVLSRYGVARYVPSRTNRSS